MMKMFCFDSLVGMEIDPFGSVKAIISKAIILEDQTVITCTYIRPNGRIENHEAVAPQLYLIVQGEGWIKSESDEKLTVQEGQAIFWVQDEWHESGTEKGMTAVIIEGVHFDPEKLLPLLQKDEL